MTAQLKVVGLKELRKALREAGDKEFANALRDANTEVAQVVLDRARPGIAAVSSTVAGSGRAAKSAVGGKIAFSSVRAGGTIYGAEHNVQRVGPSGRQFKGHNQFRTPSPDGGYHVGPEVDGALEQIATVYIDAVDRYLDKQGVPRAP